MIPDICTMEILVIAATSFEIQPYIESFGGKILVTGIGAIATAHALMRHISTQRPQIVIQAGIAGSFTPGQTGKTVAIKEEIQADLGVWENNRFKTIFDLNLVDPNAAPYQNGLLPNPHEKWLTLTNLPPVRAITVNEITTDTKRINWLQQNMAPFVESMEGAACHFVCLQENIPFLQIRTISNDIGERDKSKWDIRGAIANLNNNLIELVQKL